MLTLDLICEPPDSICILESHSGCSIDNDLEGVRGISEQARAAPRKNGGLDQVRGWKWRKEVEEG